MADRPFNVLFLCTGNSARSIIAETILNKVGAGRFRAYSAGSHPKGRVNPHTIQLLQSLDYDTSGFRSKSWSEFAKPGAPPLDFVFTVCDNAAGEACPVWPGQPMTAHWGIPDPAEATGSPAEIALAFKDAYRMLNQRIGIFTALLARPAQLRDRANGGRDIEGGRADLMQPLGKRAFSEWLGTAFLLAAVVGSGIMAFATARQCRSSICSTASSAAALGR